MYIKLLIFSAWLIASHTFFLPQKKKTFLDKLCFEKKCCNVTRDYGTDVGQIVANNPLICS